MSNFSEPRKQADRKVDKILIGPKRKIALVCSGGGSKAGAFHLGVALALQEQGFKFYGGMIPQSGPLQPPKPMEISTYVGSSAGSLISSLLASGYSLQNIFNSFLGKEAKDSLDPIDAYPKVLPKLSYPTMLKLRKGVVLEPLRQVRQLRKLLGHLMEGRFDSVLELKWFQASGIFSTSGIEQYLREEVLVSNRFQDFAADLFIVATQLNHSRKVVFGKYSYQPPPHDLTCAYDNDAPISEACAASTALPPLYAPYVIKKDEEEVAYIDGEIRDTLSTHVAIDGGADLVIASYTHQPYHWQKEVGSLVNHGLPAIVIQSIYLLIEQKINSHIHNKEIQRNAIKSVSEYCLTQGINEEHRRKILLILERELHHRTDVDSLYIHPKPDDARMFFLEHFSLSPVTMAEIVRSGFRAGTEVLSKYEFADRNSR